MTVYNASAESILMAARRAVAERGPGKLTLSFVASSAGVSRPTLYYWFPTKEHLLSALTEYERAQFDEGLRTVIGSHRTPVQRLDAALHYLVSYLDESMGPDPIGVDPAFALQSLNEGMPRQIDTMVRSLGDCLDVVPAVRAKAMTREQAVEIFLRLAYSHYLVPDRDTETMLANVRAFAGLPRRSLIKAAG